MKFVVLSFFEYGVIIACIQNIGGAMGFISAFYLMTIVVGISIQNIVKKGFNNKTSGKNVLVFNAFSVLIACMFFFVISGFKFPFSFSALPFILGFATSYFCAVLFTFLAIQVGSLSLTSLVTSYSLILPALYGLIFDGDSSTVWLYIGLALLVISIVLLNAKKDDSKITFKWAVFAAFALIGNGACAIIQTEQTKQFNGAYDKTFMAIALGIVFIAFLLFALFYEREEILPSLKKGTHFMIICGVANGASNLLVMIASTMINKSVMFPIISAGGIVVTWLVSVFLYKEKLNKWQNLAMLLGIVSIIFLNI